MGKMETFAEGKGSQTACGCERTLHRGLGGEAERSGRSVCRSHHCRDGMFILTQSTGMCKHSIVLGLGAHIGCYFPTGSALVRLRASLARTGSCTKAGRHCCVLGAYKGGPGSGESTELIGRPVASPDVWRELSAGTCLSEAVHGQVHEQQVGRAWALLAAAGPASVGKLTCRRSFSRWAWSGQTVGSG